MKGITKMTKAKHRISGYMVRTQRKGNGFRLYVSASAIHRNGGNLNERMKHAKSKAQECYDELMAVLDDPESWTKKGTVKPAPLRYLKGVGFKHYLVPPKQPAQPKTAA